MTDDEKEALVWKISIVLFTVFITTTVSCIGILFVKAYKHELILAGIDTSRCRDIECDSMRNAITVLTARVDRLPEKIPPEDFRKEVDQIKREQAVIKYILRKYFDKEAG